MSAATCNPATVQPADLTIEQVRERMAKHSTVIEELVRRYPAKRAVLLQVLWLAQQEYGWLPRVCILWAAEVAACAPAHAFGVVEFYTMYQQVPRGRHLIQICQTMCCGLYGAEKLIEHVEHRLGIHAGETTKDGLFTLVRVECLALCGTGPGVLIDDEAIGPEQFEQLPENFHPGPADLDRWIDRLSAAAKSPMTMSSVDPLGAIVLNTKGHPGAPGAAAKANTAVYAPAPPALKPNAVATGSAIALTWVNAPETVKVVVEKSADNGATWTELASVGPKDQKAADTLPEGVSAQYRFIAHEKARVARPSAVVSATGKPPPPPPAPAAAAAPAGSPAPAAPTAPTPAAGAPKKDG
jgi:NADH:ubiquinone oxidoreductase subunit E